MSEIKSGQYWLLADGSVVCVATALSHLDDGWHAPTVHSNGAFVPADSVFTRDFAGGRQIAVEKAEKKIKQIYITERDRALDCLIGSDSSQEKQNLLAKLQERREANKNIERKINAKLYAGSPNKYKIYLW